MWFFTDIRGCGLAGNKSTNLSPRFLQNSIGLRFVVCCLYPDTGITAESRRSAVPDFKSKLRCPPPPLIPHPHSPSLPPQGRRAATPTLPSYRAHAGIPHAPSLGIMSRASTHLCRKRSRDDAHGGASPTRRRRRRLAPSPFPAVRSFGLRIAVASAPQRLRKRRHDENTSWARICRSRSSCPISPSPSPAVRPFSIRVALATSPRRRRKSRVDDARLPVSTPRRRRSLLSRVKRFPGLRPFALRFLLAAGASAPRCRRNVTTVNNGGSEVHRERLEGSPEVVDLTLEKDLELEKVDVVSRGIGDWRLPALESPTPPEKRALFHKEALEWTKRRGGKLQESGFEVRLQEVKHAEIPSMLVHRSKEVAIFRLIQGLFI